MADSLVIGNKIEVMGGPGGVPSLLPECAGAVFRISQDYDLGTPQPTTDIVQSMILDGERPFGIRASNRTITLPVVIRAPSMAALAAAREILIQAIDRQQWSLTWTPDGGQQLVLDCFRALPTVIQYGFMYRAQAISTMEIKFQALPYGRSDIGSLQSVAFAAPITGGVAAPPAPKILDNFGTVSGSRWSQSSKFVVGPHSATWLPNVWPNLTPASYTASFTAVDITGLNTLSVWLGLAWNTTNYKYWAGYSGSVTFSFTLTDNTGKTIKFHVTQICAYSNAAGVPAWTRVSAPIPQGQTFDYTHLTAYTISMVNWQGKALAWVSPFLDSVTANPPSLAVPASARGNVYNVMGAVGTARAAISAQFQQPATGVPQSATLTGSGVWWPPPGVTSVQVASIGAGGAGSSRTATGNGGGGGGGGCGYEAAFAVATGAPVPYACGVAGQASPPTVVQTFNAPGTGTWTCPPNVTSILAECWGGGGAGGSPGGGGSGGCYAAKTVTVVPGVTYQYQVANGGHNKYAPGGFTSAWSSYFWNADTSIAVKAQAGFHPSDGSPDGAAAPTSGQCTGTTIHTGGAGGTSTQIGGGGGGGSGGTAANGNAGSNGGATAGGAGGVAVTNGAAGGAGANQSGFPGGGAAPGGGGGGGWGSTGGGASGANGRVQITYTPAGGAPIDGGNTTFGPAPGGAVTVLGNGGKSAPANSATGGAGGTASANTTAFAGGAGWTTTLNGGGGGSAAGPTGAGTAATSNTGAAGTGTGGGGKGGTGGVAAVAATTGTPPGGGGGGGIFTSSPAGAAGGDGQIIVTWTPTVAAFGTLVAHRPGRDSPGSLTPFVTMGSTSDPPDGREYPVPSLVSGVNARFGGTYTVLAAARYWDTPAASRTITVYVHQYEYQSGPATVVQKATTIVPTTADPYGNGLIVVGEMTLPYKDLDPSNNSAYFTVGVTDSNLNDLFLDVLFLDTQGQTVILSCGTDYSNFYIDEPPADRDIGRILASAYDRSQAVSVMDQAIISGGPLTIDPGDNLLLAYAVEGAPNLAVSYIPRWYTERLA